jgi:hypothetical protein
MPFRTKLLVSAILPMAALLLIHGCGSKGAPESKPASGPVTPEVSTPATTNRAPTIGGKAGEYARVGETYSFLPEARDPEGDSLRFSAVNLPPWASIDPTNGRITGTPGPADEGIYESIAIVVADAARSTQGTTFSITVIAEAATGVASLRWEVPPAKLDGSPLDDLAGYRILYGRSSDNLDRSILISDPAVTSYDVGSLTSGIWYFAVVAVNAGGLEGPPTTIMTKSI